MNNCRICGEASSIAPWTIPETMYATGESFEYLLCGSCGCLQIASFPADMGRYYASGYYSFAAPRHSLVERIVRWLRDRQALTGAIPWGNRLLERWPNVKLSILRKHGLKPESRILDVGCGGGYLLSILWQHGFRNLAGSDPFVESDIEFRPDAWIRKQALEAAGSGWDFILFNHSLEHMPEQVSVLSAARRLLASQGTCIVRIPLVSGEAWTRYGVHWAQIDAPRHFYLHSRKSIEIAARAAGFRIVDEIHDSEEFQFYGSALAARGLGHKQADPSAHFSVEEWRSFRQEARRLNLERRGDQAAFVLTPD